MTAAPVVLIYALLVAWYSPALLTRLTARGISPRFGLAAWLTAMASVLVSAGAAVQFLVRATIAGWPGLAEAVCRSVAGGACGPTVYRGAAFELGLGVAALLAALTAATLAWRYGRSVQRAQRGTRAHAEAARITGSSLPDSPAAVVLDAPEPVAYCLAGRPATIVLTSGALAVLDRLQLGAVLAHERAHLTGRHHVLIALTRALSATFPGVPLFTRGPEEVARLAEMCADDTAARHSGRRTLVTALLAMGTGAAVPAASLGASAYEVTARVQRLLNPPCRARHARYGLALAAVTVSLALACSVVIGLAGPLAARSLALG